MNLELVKQALEVTGPATWRLSGADGQTYTERLWIVYTVGGSVAFGLETPVDEDAPESLWLSTGVAEAILEKWFGGRLAERGRLVLTSPADQAGVWHAWVAHDKPSGTGPTRLDALCAAVIAVGKEKENKEFRDRVSTVTTPACADCGKPAGDWVLSTPAGVRPICSACAGKLQPSEGEPAELCDRCGGTGWIEWQVHPPSDPYERETCPRCGGAKVVPICLSHGEASLPPDLQAEYERLRSAKEAAYKEWDRAIKAGPYSRICVPPLGQAAIGAADALISFLRGVAAAGRITAQQLQEMNRA